MNDMTLKDMAEQWWTQEKGNGKPPPRSSPKWGRMWKRFCLETFGIEVDAPKAGKHRRAA